MPSQPDLDTRGSGTYADPKNLLAEYARIHLTHRRGEIAIVKACSFRRKNLIYPSKSWGYPSKF